MPTEISTGILGISPDFLKFGALGLLAISIIVVAVVTFSGARSRTSFRLALVFMGFTLIVAALAIGSEMVRDNSVLTRTQEDLVAAKAHAAASDEARDAAVKARDEARAAVDGMKAEMTKAFAAIGGETRSIANALDAKWCIETKQQGDSSFRTILVQLINQMRTSITNIQKTVGGSELPFAPECVDLGNP